jgi:alpha/beta superfamily hydrolase
MKTKNVFFPCGKLKLEGFCYYPDGKGKFPAVVLCHPHPVYGGSMDNNVILALASALVKKSIIAFMFNFRGVGRSQGSFGGGIDEQDDVAAALNWLVAQREADTGRIGLAGYSFGALVALPQACRDPRIRAVALISPAIMEQGTIAQLKNCTIPKLIISGDADKSISSEQLRLMNQEAAEPKRLELISGADHFWLSQEISLADKVVTFFSAVFM